MTKAITKASKRSKLAFKLFEEIKQIKELLEKGMLVSAFELGKRFKKIRDEDLYIDMGYDSFAQLVSDPEIKQFSPATAYNSIQYYETFILKFGLTPKSVVLEGVHIYQLRALLPIIDKKNYQKWLAKARSLSRSDFSHEVNEAKANIGFKKLKRLPKQFRCRDCEGIVIDIVLKDLCKCGKNHWLEELSLDKSSKEN